MDQLHILKIGLERPVVIQSLFPPLDGLGPPPVEIDEYTHHLQELKAAGAQISLVQIYSAHRPAQNPHCGHLSLKSLSKIARRVRKTTGLRAEVYCVVRDWLILFYNLPTAPALVRPRHRF